jgi:putative ABC transport system permease protein
MKMAFCEPTTGRAPKAENEIIADTKTLDLLGVPHEIGAIVPLSFTMKGKQVQADFVLSGYWESDPIENVGFTIVSRAFVDAHKKELENTFLADHDMSGSINSHIMFHNSMNLEKKLYKVITDSGYTVLEDGENRELLPSDIAYNVNWAYLSSGFSMSDPSGLISVFMAVVLIIFTGYLIIYNIFQISIIRDIRFYGLLKTIGTTPKQIRQIIYRQAFILSIIGIPIGLIGGFIIGKALLPMIISISSMDERFSDVSLNPVIFVSAALFALLTVWISTRKPGRIAAKVSSVEAVRYNENSVVRKKIKRSSDGRRIWKMALSNIGRNRRRTVIVIISMSLSLVLLNTVFTLSIGFDIDKYLSKFVNTDFLIGHANYFNINRFRQPEDALSEEFISAVEAREGFEEGSRLYYNIYLGQCSIYRENPDEPGYFGYPMNLAQDGMPMLDLFGMEDLLLNSLDVVEGELDMEKLKGGGYILEGVHNDDNGNILWDTSHYKIGETVRITVDGKAYEYEVMAKIRINPNTIGTRFFSEFAMYLPAPEYLKIVSRPVLMTYAFNVSDDMEADMEAFVKNYTESIEPLMNYESKQVYLDSFRDMQNMLITVGGALCIIIGLIGILNFVNSILTGIVARRREFAMLQSIGMTGRQLNQMLCCEGLYYAIATMLFSLAAGILFSVGIVGGIVSRLWFFSYHFVIVPLLIAYPILIVLSIIVPYIAYHSSVKQSIVERLREAE